MSSTTSRASVRGSSPSLSTSTSSSSGGSSAHRTNATFSGFPPPSMSGSTSCNINAQSCAAPPPATLYLYTFLSTLIILLFVSGGIIARSVVLRRRQQIAIANGTWVGPRRRENCSNYPTPVMFDAYLAAGSQNEEEERWSFMKPFSTSNIAPPEKVPVPPLAVSPHHVPIRDAARYQMRSRLRLHNPFRPPSPPLPLSQPVTEVASHDPPAVNTPSSSSKVRVALLIAMPWQQMSTPDEEELPYLEFGVHDVDVVDLGKRSAESETEGADLGETKS